MLSRALFALMILAQPGEREYVLTHEGTEVLTVKLRPSGGQVSGEVMIATRSMPFTGTISGDRVSFTVNAPDGTQTKWAGPISSDRFVATVSDHTGSQTYTLMARSAGWSDATPLAKSWTNRLTGRFLTKTERTGGGSSGGALKEMFFTFCENGNALYRENFSLSISVPGLDGGRNSQTEDPARWRVVTRGSTAAIEVTTKEGERYQLGIREGSDPSVIIFAEQPVRLAGAGQRCAHPAFR